MFYLIEYLKTSCHLNLLFYYKMFISLDPIYEEEMPPVQQNTTTYEELRKKNREEYQKRRTGVFKYVNFFYL